MMNFWQILLLAIAVAGPLNMGTHIVVYGDRVAVEMFLMSLKVSGFALSGLVTSLLLTEIAGVQWG